MKSSGSGDKIYLGVEFIDGPLVKNSLKEAYYKVLPEVRFYSDEVAESYLFEPGNLGTLDYSITDFKDNKFQFSFAPIEIAGEIR